MAPKFAFWLTAFLASRNSSLKFDFVFFILAKARLLETLAYAQLFAACSCEKKLIRIKTQFLNKQ